MLFFTADQHFGHKNIIQHCNRPFGSLEEMDAVLEVNWNAVVGKEDLVYHLGDFAWCRKPPEHLLARLNGEIILVKGNHDRAWVDKHPRFTKVCRMEDISHEGRKIVLCHYALRTWAGSYRGSWHLYGHSHGKLKQWGKSWDVGVDNNDFTPLSMNQVVKILSRLPDLVV